jgi:hypothetical protein
VDQLFVQATPLQAIVVAGATLSAFTNLLWTVSAFPATSYARYLTVVLVETGNGAL